MHSIHMLEVRQGASHASRIETEIASHVHTMGASAIFAGLSTDQRRDFASCARVRVFATDEVLFMQGQPVRTHVLLQSGSVKVTQVSSTGREVLLWMNGWGEAVGIPSEAPACRHACSARAMQPCRALVWEDSRFQSLMQKHPQIGININRMLSHRLVELEERFREIATERVETRLSCALTRLAAQVGTPVHGGVEVSLSREELAQMIGTTLFTVSRILSKWGDEGFVGPRRDAVIVYDSERLLLAGA
jgi:CRP-like cAMP-binding protein